jgi:hypothetical protein
VSLGVALLYALGLQVQGSKYRLWRPSVKKSAGISELGCVDGEATGASLLCLDISWLVKAWLLARLTRGRRTFRPKTKFCLFLLSSEDSEIQILVRAQTQKGVC